MILWDKVKDKRIQLNLTQRKVAEKLGLVNSNVYSFYERDKVKKVPQHIIENLSVILDLPIEEITKSASQIILDAYTDDEKNFITSPEGQMVIKKAMFDHLVYKAGLEFLKLQQASKETKG